MVPRQVMPDRLWYPDRYAAERPSGDMEFSDSANDDSRTVVT